MSSFALPLLALVAFCDLRYLRIPDKLTLLALAVFPVIATTLPLSEIGLRALVAMIAFGIGFIAFSRGLFGGGDVKFLPVLLLFIPSNGLVLFAYCLSASIILAIATVTAGRYPVLAIPDTWAFKSRPNGLPLGLSFAYAGFLYFFLAAG